MYRATINDYATVAQKGIRTSKTRLGGIKVEYLLSGTKIVAETADTYTILYIYDASGSPIGMRYRLSSYAADVWNTFWFEKNLQGDIIAVYNENGTKCISYLYDAWGNCTISSETTNTVVANANVTTPKDTTAAIQPP